jgi:hypothetical protein
VFQIGESLREARTRRGFTAADVHKAIRIRERYLTALEEERWDMLPGEAYTKGFLRTYSDHLGLDGQLYVDEYNSRNVVDSFDDMPQRRPARRHERSVEKRVVLLALAGIAALTGLVIIAWRFGGGNSASPGVVTQQHHAAPSGLRFVGYGKGTYLEVRRRSAAGHMVFQGTLRPGDSEFVIGKRFWLYVRRPAGVRFKLGGKPVSLPARRNLRVVVTPTKTVRVGV